MARRRERNTTQAIFHLMVHPSNTQNSQNCAKTKAEKKNSILVVHEWQQPKFLSHHLLPPWVETSRKVELEI